MQYVTLGKTGQKVSRICLGCMSFGNEAEWMIDGEAANKIIRKALDLGITFFDTADVYSQGRSEEILGRALSGWRNDAVIATKVGLQFGEGPNNVGLSKTRVFKQVAASLSRLKTDYIDLYQIHRWDYSTSIDETLSALTQVVREGKVKHVGASSMFAWQFVQALWMSEKRDYESFVSMQNRYNLVYREEEREMIPACREYGIAMIPYSPLARGFLSGKYKKGTRPRTLRYMTDRYFKGGYFYDNDYDVLRRLIGVAKEKDVKPAQVALAWLFSKPYITAPILGARKVSHLEDAVEALSIRMSDDDVKELEEPYQPHQLHGPARPPQDMG